MTLAFSKDTFALRAAAVEKEILLHCYRFMGSVQDSEDMYQETLIRAWARRDSLISEENFRPWLYKIASNICLDHLKKTETESDAQHAIFGSRSGGPLFPNFHRW